MKRCAIALAILVLMVADIAQAQFSGPATPRGGHWEFTIQTIYMGSQDYKGEHGSSISLDDDLGWGFGFGYNISDLFNLGLSLSWRSMSYYATIVDAENENATTHYSNWLDTATMALCGEYSFLRSRITPYASGRVGWTSIDTNIIASSDYGCWWDPWYGYICESYDTTYGADAASWALGAGVRFELSPAAFMRVGYEHGWIDANAFDSNDLFRLDFGLMY
jgi:opacity protein-like surface antigen